MKKTLITLAALAASVAGAATIDEAAYNLSGDNLKDSSLTGLSTDFTMTLVLDWDKIATNSGAWNDQSRVVLGTHGQTNWWTTGFGMFAGGGDFTGQLAVSMILDNKPQSLTGANDTDAEDGVTVNAGFIGEGYFIVDNTHNVNGKLALTFSYVADSDSETEGNQSVGTLYALKNDGTLSAVYATQDNVWNLAADPFNIAGVTDKGAMSQLLIFDSALSAAEVAAVSTAVVPEPATATLSLLALAGLAARRRRK